MIAAPPPAEVIQPGAPRLMLDGRWAEGRRLPVPWMIGLVTFAILALELAFIRWTSSQVRVFAYFNNLVLIGAFLGMGLGLPLGRRFPGLIHLALPLLVAVSVPIAFSEALGLVHLQFPDQTVVLWGGTQVRANPGQFALSIGIFLGLFLGIVAVFVCCGAALGHLFPRLAVLRAYHADLWGSLLGIVAFALAAWCGAGPAVWLALGVLPIVVVTRRPLALILGVAAIALAQYSVKGAIYSPYNRIDIARQRYLIELQVNRDFHQYMHDLSPARLADTRLAPDVRQSALQIRALYDLPFVLNGRRETALIVGAGTGNDVQAALRNGYRAVTSVDIDASIIALGRAMHPEQPYSHPGVRPVVDDARSFFSSDRGTYDVVCFGLLDSHAMSSAMSTLRLDNYVYTEEGIRAAWQRVGPHGHLSLAISCAAGSWFFERLYWTVAAATGREPVALFSPFHGNTATFLVAREGVGLDPAQLARWPAPKPRADAAHVLKPSDDWPFLYIRPNTFPWGYVIVLGVILLLAAFSIPRAFAVRAEKTALDWPLFLMGAAFLLIETRGVTSMSLLFGSTWTVNAAIFGGILAMVLLANLAVQRGAWSRLTPWFGALFGAVLLLYFFPVAWLQGQPFLVRGLLAGAITGLPVGIAGVIVPMLLRSSLNPAAALGSNLLGAVLGGCLEYYSMLGGLKTTALMALALYLAAFWAARKARPLKA